MCVASGRDGLGVAEWIGDILRLFGCFGEKCRLWVFFFYFLPLHKIMWHLFWWLCGRWAVGGGVEKRMVHCYEILFGNGKVRKEGKRLQLKY